MVSMVEGLAFEINGMNGLGLSVQDLECRGRWSGV